MDPLAAALVVVLLVLGTTALGALWRARQGRVRAAHGALDRARDGVELAPDVTLVQFSSELCAPCVGTARILGEIAATTPGIGHVEIDVAERPELAARFGVLQTPTTLVVDGAGHVRARIGGAVRRDELAAAIHGLVGDRAAA